MQLEFRPSEGDYDSVIEFDGQNLDNADNEQSAQEESIHHLKKPKIQVQNQE